MGNGTLLLSRADVDRVLTPAACLAAVESAFRQYALGQLPPPGILGVPAGEGGFHVKAAQLTAGRRYFAAKLNANFPHNGMRHGLPTIQGVVALCDAENGVPLAILDSISVTALRTAAATALAAKHFARETCEAVLICGCGGQAAAQLRALAGVRAFKRVHAFDQDSARAARFAVDMSEALGMAVTPAADLATVAPNCDVIVTCTTSRRYFLTPEMVRPGAFVAAVGADSEGKQEIAPQLLAAATVVTDLTAQASTIGDLHHALAAGTMTLDSVHAELGEVVCGSKRGRGSADETIVFDSTGTGLQDVAAAVAAYLGALDAGAGTRFSFSSIPT